MAYEASLISVLRILEHSAEDAIVCFSDGEAYRIQVISTKHANDGGDIVAKVLPPTSTSIVDNIPVGTFINFFLTDVNQVVVRGNVFFQSLRGLNGNKDARGPLRPNAQSLFVLVIEPAASRT